MREITIQEREAGQRFDKFLHKYMKDAPSSFFYKMLRKKNITLNRKKADGREKLAAGDTVSLFLAEETILKFQGAGEGTEAAQTAALTASRHAAVTAWRKALQSCEGVTVLWENEHVLFANKPVGLLSQKARAEDVSLNEWLVGYLLEKGDITEEELVTFRPSVCNRLDRNTSGIVLCAKTLTGSQELSRLLKDRSLKKYYRLFVEGSFKEKQYLKGYLWKDAAANRVTLTEEAAEGGVPVCAEYEPLWQDREVSYLEGRLITGKSHQIRAQLAAIGHPLIGDFKYGGSQNRRWKEKLGITHQLLHAFRLEMPALYGPLSDMSGLVVCAPEPELFERLRRFCGSGRKEEE